MKKKFSFSDIRLILFCFFSLLSLGAIEAYSSSYPATPMENGWTEVKPGGETICARGTEYSFFHYPGKTNKVVIDFIGGGACWDGDTCAEDSKIFTDTIDDLKERVKGGVEGHYDHKHAGNPIADWHHIIIPYCTGDIHWGNSVQTYKKGDKEFTIHHKGAVNAKVVLDWIFENFPNPEQVFITGCSAGSYGSVYWTPYIREHYPTARINQLGDSGAGVITKNFIRNNFPIWNAVDLAADWIPNLDPRRVDWYNLSLESMYTEIGKFYPEIRLSQYNTAFDSTQILFFELMGGGGEKEWSTNMFRSQKDIASAVENFNYYIGAGQNHCILPYNFYYDFSTEGVTFLNWLNEFLSDRPAKNVTCVDCDPINIPARR